MFKLLFHTVSSAMQNVQCQNMACHHQEGSISNVRAGVCNCRPEFHLIEHLEYTSFSNTEVQDYIFMSSALDVNAHKLAKCE